MGCAVDEQEVRWGVLRLMVGDGYVSSKAIGNAGPAYPAPRLEAAVAADRMDTGLGAAPGRYGGAPRVVWLDTPGKVLHVEAARLECQGGPPA
jgi:hypothetical protein